MSDPTRMVVQVNLDIMDHWYNRFLYMTDDMLGPSPMHIKYLSYVYDFPGPIESVISKFTCISRLTVFPWPCGYDPVSLC